MQIADLQKKLADLNITLTTKYDQHDKSASKADIITYRQYRASVYWPLLENTAQFLHGKIKEELELDDEDWAFLREALESGALLNDLAMELDRWLCPALDQALQSAKIADYESYKKYFDANVFDSDDSTYRDKAHHLLEPYPKTRHVLSSIVRNFQNNVLTTCRRVSADRKLLGVFLSDRYGQGEPLLVALKKISSTGSDFHKGGQQVLILTFAAKIRQSDGTAAEQDLKVVYKPSDLEIDCLLTGDSATARRVLGDGYMEQSLVEIFNAALPTVESKGVGEAVVEGAPKLPTYRILPVSGSRSGGTATIRECYGYIEYLPYGSDEGDTSDSFTWEEDWRKDRPGESTQAQQSRKAKASQEDLEIQTFYRQLGQWVAIACTFSLIDLHVENVRACGRQAYLIDLECSLTEAINSISLTTLLDVETGGATASELPARSDLPWELHRGRNDLYFDRNAAVSKRFQNKLRLSGSNRRAIPVAQHSLCAGLYNGMLALRSRQTKNAFDRWLQRLDGVVVRVLPVRTQDWIDLRTIIYERHLQASPESASMSPEEVARDFVRTCLQVDADARLTAYTSALKVPEIPDLSTNAADVLLARTKRRHQAHPPEFVAMCTPQAIHDLVNFDIPVFYHRLGTTTLLDSTGEPVDVPDQVVVKQGPESAETVRETKLKWRKTYFETEPVKHIHNQVAALAGEEFEGWEEVLARQARKLLRV